MKKISRLCLASVICLQAGVVNAADEGGNYDLVLAGGKHYLCEVQDETKATAERQYGKGNVLALDGGDTIQTLLDGHSYTCVDGAGDKDTWGKNNTVWCKDTKIKELNVQGAEYCVYGSDGSKKDDWCTSKAGGVEKALKGGCLYGFMPNGEAKKNETTDDEKGQLLQLTDGKGGSKWYGCCVDDDTCPEKDGNGKPLASGRLIKSSESRILQTLYGQAYKCIKGEWKPTATKWCDGVKEDQKKLNDPKLEYILKIDSEHRRKGGQNDVADYLGIDKCLNVKGEASKPERAPDQAESSVIQYGCGINSITLRGSQKPSHDEFLYQDKASWASVENYTNPGTYTVQGLAYECDYSDSQWCKKNEDIPMPAGHYFKGKLVDKEQAYKCTAGNVWKPVDEISEFSSAGCGANAINLDGNQKPRDDEFLYSTVMAWYSVADQEGVIGDIKLTAGQAYECDDKHCNTKEPVTLGPWHVFKGEIVHEETKYECRGAHNSFDEQDHWVAVEVNGQPVYQDIDQRFGDLRAREATAKCLLKNCGALSSGRSVTTAAPGLILNNYLTVQSKALVCPVGMAYAYPLEAVAAGHLLTKKAATAFEVANEYLKVPGGCLECDTPQLTNGDECSNGTVVVGGNIIHRCAADQNGTDDKWEQETNLPLCSDSLPLDTKFSFVTVKAKYQHDIAYGETALMVFSQDACFMVECPSNTSYDKEKRECVLADEESPAQQTCVDKRKTKNGKACCSLPMEVAKYDEQKDECICQFENHKFEIVDENKGQCVSVGGEEACTEQQRETLNVWLEKCSPNAEGDKVNKLIVENINELLEICKGEVVEKAVFDQKWQVISEINPDNCSALPQGDQGVVRVVGKDPAPKPQADEGLIKSSRESLNKISGKFKTSVWKNAEGKFNAVRLASDLTAGVVLGTTGALVTSHLVKKKQVEDGFEDLKCTVGGQVVADWGDIFQVGIK